MTDSTSKLGASIEAHYVKQGAAVEKMREATKDDPSLPKPTNFHEAAGRAMERANREAEYKRSQRNA